MKEKLFRSRKQKVIAGVAGGLADYFNIDPVIVRILFVLLTIFHGSGILIYFILWIAVPEEPLEIAYNINVNTSKTDENHSAEEQEIKAIPKNSPRYISGTILIIIGVIFLFKNIIPTLDLSDLLPYILILAGIFLISNSYKK